MSCAVDEDLAVDPHPLDEVVHAVEGAEQGGFAAARGPDERGDGLPGKSDVDILQGLKGPVEQIEAPEHDDVRSRSRGALIRSGRKYSHRSFGWRGR